MKFWNQLTGILVLIVALSASILNAQDLTPGVVRISDQDVIGNQMKLQSHAVRAEVGCTSGPACACEMCQSCDDDCDDDWEDCEECECDDSIFGKFFHNDCHRCQQARNCPYCSKGLNCPHHCDHNLFKKCCKAQNRFGYFHPAQTPPFGCYKIAYPVNPGYFDQRDGSMYAAQGYGVNVSVPLAPNVGATYNYGWGVPSSRLTPISNYLPAPPMPQTVYPPRTQVYPPMMMNRVPPQP